MKIYEKYDGLDEMCEEKEELRDKLSEVVGSDAKSGWKDRFRLRDGKILQRPCLQFQTNVEKTLSAKNRKALMTESDWVDVICIDDEEFFNRLNKIHWHESPSKHKRPAKLFEAAKAVLDSNITNEICVTLVSCCPVCKNEKNEVATKEKPKKKSSSSRQL